MYILVFRWYGVSVIDSRKLGLGGISEYVAVSYCDDSAVVLDALLSVFGLASSCGA